MLTFVGMKKETHTPSLYKIQDIRIGITNSHNVVVKCEAPQHQQYKKC